MKIIISFLLLTSLTLSAYGQLDVTVQYEFPSYAKWEESVQSRFANDEKLIDFALYGGVAWRIYPMEIRLGIIPEIYYSYGSGQAGDLSTVFDYHISQTGLRVAAQLFPFDLYGDCNCPTFGRQNDFFQRAFYLKLSAGVQYQWLQVEEMLKNSNIVFLAGGGAGLNIALNQLVTFAPEINYHQVFNAKWEGFNDLHNRPGINDKSTGNLLNIGLRISFYFEE